MVKQLFYIALLSTQLSFVQGKGFTYQYRVNLLLWEYMAGVNARQLYGGNAWKHTRAAYLKSVGGLCERCSAKGLVVPAEVVHHITPITEDNVNDTSVSLSWDNLQALCRKCHAEVHDDIYREKNGRRYKLDEFGRVIIV